MNYTYSNYTEAAATCSAAQQHSTFTVQILYKLYSLQMNCTYSNYTEAAATCSAAQQHSTFTVQILYKLYSLQMNCTYSNYTQAAAICSAAQEHRNSPADVFWNAVLPVAWYFMFIYRQSHTEIWSFKAVQLTVNAMPHPKAPLNTRFSARHATEMRVLRPTRRSGCDDVIEHSSV